MPRRETVQSSKEDSKKLKMSESSTFRSQVSVTTNLSLNSGARAVSGEPCSSVFFVGAYSSPSQGSRGITEDLCAHLCSSGWNMRIVSQRPSRAGRLFEMLWTSWSERNRYQVAAVDLYSGPAFFWAQAVCWSLRRARKPYVLMLHGGNLPEFAHRRPGLVRNLLASAAAVTTPSAYLKELMKPYRQNIELLPNAIDIGRYELKPPSHPAPRLIWLRAFHEVYNPVMAVQVLARLVHEFPDIHLTMVGPDKGDGTLRRTRQEAERLGVADCLTISGAVKKEQVPGTLAEGHIFLNTAQIDNTPVSLLEAMATGLPVVSTNVGGIPYLVETEREALLVPPCNPEKMADAVRRIIVEPELSTRLSQNARVKAEQFDWSIILPRWAKLFESVLQHEN